MNELNIFEIERFAIHDGPGIRTVVFLQGCPLRCAWCANPESQTSGKHIMRFSKQCTGCGSCVRVCKENAIEVIQGKAVADRHKCISCGKCVEECLNGAMKISGRTISCDELFRLVMRDEDYYKESGGGVTLSGGEALLQIDRLTPFLEQCKANGLHIAAESCGHVSVEVVKKAAEYVDLFLFDIKSLDSDRFRRFTGGDVRIVLDAFEYLAGTWPDRVIVRVPVIPGFNDDEIKAIIEFAASKNAKTIHLLPYHTLGVSKYQQLGMEYPYPVLESLAPDSLLPYIEIGEKLGATVSIGG
ncbi:MAG: glycyl-radical enzyme activating protein [Acetatifactor sp.]